MKVYAVIVTFNGSAWIRGALQSLRDSLHPCTAVVVDNASTDDTAAIVRTEFTEVVLIDSGANLGFGQGNNVGISHALRRGAEAVFLLNQDATVTPEAIGQLVAFLHEQPAFHIVCPLHCGPDLSRVDPMTLRVYLQRYAPTYLSDACLNRVQPHYEIRGINAAAWLLRAEVFRRVGGFDPLYFMYGEDDDLIERCAHHGIRTALVPSALIVHLRAKPPRPAPNFAHQVAGLAARRRSALLLDLKQPGGRLPGQLLRLLSAGAVQPLAACLVDHDLKTLLANLLASLRVLADIGKARRHARLCAQPGAHFLNLDQG
jgi:GT2 family glycosyltransferase